jgi:hypothetical protein
MTNVPLIFFLQLPGPAASLSRKFLHDLTTAQHYKSFFVYMLLITKKMPAVRQQFCVRGSISDTSRPRTRAA